MVDATFDRGYSIRKSVAVVYSKRYNLYPHPTNLCSMLAEILDLDDKEVEIKLQDEDISVMYIVQHELLKEKNVEFAGVVLKHPLIEDFLIRVITKKKDPIAAFQDACDTASEIIQNTNAVLSEALTK